MQQIQGFEGVEIGVMLVIVGLTDVLGAKHLWENIRKGKFGKMDKAAPVIIRCAGVAMILLGILLVVF
ncbi:hypothetical protein [Alkalibacterium olivapovliticus]|nr:hypothetical protein [Alkalibacterium olivapovliticus]